MFRKLVLVTFVAVCFASFAQATLTEDLLYDAIVALRYSDKPAEEKECLKKQMKNSKFVDKFPSDALSSLVYDHNKLRNELNAINSDFKTLETVCEWIPFLQTPLGICIIVLIAILLLSLIIGICKCICC